MRRTLLPMLAGLMATLLLAAPAAAEVCDPTQVEPRFAGEVPTAQSLGIPLGERELTTEEAYRFVDAVDASSDLVVSGTFGRSQQGRPLRYAIVGSRRAVSETGLERIRRATAALQDPATPARRVQRLVRRTPATLWVAGNVHGDEESGTEGSLQALHELADRRDCVARGILDEAIVVVVPTQNPDGREADTRRSALGFDLNRDWFARTHPETDSKLELMRRLPPQLFIDAHEMGSQRNYFFPPNPDPIYHEITRQSVQWIDSLYGAAMAREFTRRGIEFFTNETYDLFYMGYGDTVPSTAFTAAGMTFEKTNSDPIAERTRDHYVAIWTSLVEGARERTRILREWHAAWVEAVRQGEAGILEPNEVNDPGSEVLRPVSTDPVRHYFLRADDPDKRAEVRQLVRRLQRMDVEVRRLRAPLEVPDFKPYGRPRGATTLPAGTYWVPMAQRQKHWVQAMLHEDPYVPFPYFYDVSAWSNPLLFNVAGGSSGAVLAPRAARLRTVFAEPAPAALPDDVPRVAVHQLPGNSGTESAGWLRWRLGRWGISFEDLTAEQVAGGGLEGIDVLLVPNGDAAAAGEALGDAGRAALQGWLNGGGRLITWRNGAVLAAQLGLTTAQLSTGEGVVPQIPGSLLRVRMDEGSPLGEGVGPFNHVMVEFDPILRPSRPEHAVATFPPVESPDFFLSGYGEGLEVLGGTAAAIAEPIGSGSVVAFANDPNYRAFTDGSAKVLRNAILAEAPVAPRARAARAGSPALARRAARASRTLHGSSDDLWLAVPARDARRAEAVLDRLAAHYQTGRTGGVVRFRIANPAGLSAEQHPFARALPRRLERAGVGVVAFRAP